MKKFMVKKRSLLLIACAVWVIAGANILNIGLSEYPGRVTVVNVVLSGAVFAAFQFLVFGKLVRTHTKRIVGYLEERQFFLRFFDRKAFIVMACMMTFGIALRASGLVPAGFIAVFYTGLGAALLLAGVRFGWSYVSGKGAGVGSVGRGGERAA